MNAASQEGLMDRNGKDEWLVNVQGKTSTPLLNIYLDYLQGNRRSRRIEDKQQRKLKIEINALFDKPVYLVAR